MLALVFDDKLQQAIDKRQVYVVYVRRLRVCMRRVFRARALNIDFLTACLLKQVYKK